MKVGVRTLDFVYLFDSVVDHIWGLYYSRVMVEAAQEPRLNASGCKRKMSYGVTGRWVQIDASIGHGANNESIDYVVHRIGGCEVI